jgi:phospholipid transport system substrate-binding protein
VRSEGRGAVLSRSDQEPRDQQGMTTVGTKLAGGSAWRRRSARAVADYVAAGFLAMWVGLAGAPASAGDPAVIFMAQVGKELMAAARTRSPGAMASVVERHADVTQIGLFSLGEYRNRLPQEERPSYFSGMARFIGRYAANESPKYPLARVEWANQSVRSGSGVMVDSRIVLADGSAYDVRWALTRHGTGFKVRDAMVLGFWMTPFLKNLFEDYIAKNGGNPRALTAALNR